MKPHLNSLLHALLLAFACLGAPSNAEEHKGDSNPGSSLNEQDINRLYELVRETRADLSALRKQAGIEFNREGRGEHAERERGEHAEGHEGRGEHAERERGEHTEGREGRGEHGGEEGGQRLRKNQVWSNTRNGARMVLVYNSDTQSFMGVVQNVTNKPMSQVRVEVHLSNGAELGPTKRTDLKPGAKMPVELSAVDQEFTWWTTHPEHGNEENHGPGHEESGDEHGRGRGDRPAAALRPLHNELLLLRNEVKMLSDGLSKQGGREHR